MSSNNSDSITKTSRGPDALAPQADHSLGKGLPGTGKSAFSHTRDFEDGPIEKDGPAGEVERLTADTPAYNRGEGRFIASLHDSVEKQEENQLEHGRIDAGGNASRRDTSSTKPSQSEKSEGYASFSDRSATVDAEHPATEASGLDNASSSRKTPSQDRVESREEEQPDQGLPGTGKSAFSHAKDFENGPARNEGPAGEVERLTAGTAAYNRGEGKFIASLHDSVDKQEEPQPEQTESGNMNTGSASTTKEGGAKGEDSAKSGGGLTADAPALSGDNNDSVYSPQDAVGAREHLQPDQGLPSTNRSAFSHVKDFEAGAVVNDGPAGEVERLTADTAASNRGDGNFMASLQDSIETQEENQSTAI